MIVIRHTTRFRFKSVLFHQISFQRTKRRMNIKATGIGRKHEKKDFIMYVDCPKIPTLRSDRKQSKDIIVSEVCPTT